MNRDIQNFFKYSSTVLVTIVVSMTGFWMMIGREYVTRSEMREEINNTINARIAVIDQKLEHNIQGDERILEVLENNTQAVSELKIQVGMLNKTLEFLEKRLDADPTIPKSKRSP